MTAADRNRETVLRYVDAFNRYDVPALRALFTPDALIYGVLSAGPMEVALPIWRELHESLAMRLTVEAMIAEGDNVAVRYTERGRFVGPFLGQAPTGRSFEVTAMEWFEMREGLIHRRWGARDSAAIARQIGLPLSGG